MTRFKGFSGAFPFLLVLVTALTLFVWGIGPDSPFSRANAAQDGAVPAAPEMYGFGNPYLIADVAEKVTPAVVYIEASWPARTGPQNPFNDPFFRDFFPFNPWPDMGPQFSRGTGFLIDQEGHILTNQHVVGDPGDGQTITVKISTPDFEGEVEAELLGADYRLDLAILKVEKPRGLDRFPVLETGDSDRSRPGEWVIAVGNPYGEQFEHTVTVGVLSAKGREIEIYDHERGQWKEYTDLMQTDAAINPGNSGGPLINIRGEAIGINTAVNTQGQGIGFAVPINTALEVKDQLIREGKVKRAYLGVTLTDISERLAETLGLPSTQGSMIVEIGRGTAAHRAGLEVYDVVLRFDDQEITSTEELIAAINSHRPGDEVLVVVWRRGRRLVVPVTLGEAPAGF